MQLKHSLQRLMWSLELVYEVLGLRYSRKSKRCYISSQSPDPSLFWIRDVIYWQLLILVTIISNSLTISLLNCSSFSMCRKTTYWYKNTFFHNMTILYFRKMMTCHLPFLLLFLLWFSIQPSSFSSFLCPRHLLWLWHNGPLFIHFQLSSFCPHEIHLIIPTSTASEFAFPPTPPPVVNSTNILWAHLRQYF